MKELLTLAFIATSSLIAAIAYYFASKGGITLYAGTMTQPWATWHKTLSALLPKKHEFVIKGIWHTTMSGRQFATNNIQSVEK